MAPPRKTKNQAEEPLDPYEWDFSDCPEEELEFCCKYEFAREQTHVLARVARKRRQKIGNSFTIDPDTEFSKVERLVSFLIGFKEFPKTPWLRITAQKRKESCKAGYQYFCPIIPVSPERITESGMVPTDVDEDQLHTVHVIEIDWTASDLTKGFEWFLEQHAPKAAIRENRIGQTSPREKLIYLGAYRLMRQCKRRVGDVEKCLAKRRKEVGALSLAPSYPDASSWYRAHTNGLGLIEHGYIPARKAHHFEKKDARLRGVEKARADALRKEAAQKSHDEIALDNYEKDFRKRVLKVLKSDT